MNYNKISGNPDILKIVAEIEQNILKGEVIFDAKQLAIDDFGIEDENFLETAEKIYQK